MDITELALPQAILDDNAEFIIEMRFDEDKMISDNRFFKDYVLSLSKYVAKRGLGLYEDGTDSVIYIYGKENNTDHNNIISTAFKIYETEWIRKNLSVYNWYSLYDISHGDDVEDMLEIFNKKGI